MSDAKIQKPTTRLSYGQVIQRSYNDADSTVITSGFVSSKIGNKITRIDTAGGDLNGAAAGDDFTYYDGDTLLYTLRILYEDSQKTVFSSAERVE